MRRAQRRGQATVETALGLIVFITVLIFGIHFAELTVMQMKVTEAAASAVWDSTQGQMHSLPFSYSEVNGSVGTAQASAQARYSDFDGRRAVTRGAGPSEVFTRGSGMQVTCGVGAGLPAYTLGVAPIPLFGTVVYRDNGGMSCSAEARTQAFGFGPFLEGAGGFFQASQKTGTAMNSGMKVCAVGRPSGLNGACRGRFSMLIDDWGLANGSALGGTEGSICPSLPFGFPCVGMNMPYWTLVNSIYTPWSLMFGGQNGADANLLRAAMGSLPPTIWIPIVASPTSFHMSFYGEQTLHMGWTPWVGDGGGWYWQTSPHLWFPTYMAAYLSREKCYLGKKCNQTSGRGGSTP